MIGIYLEYLLAELGGGLIIAFIPLQVSHIDPNQGVIGVNGEGLLVVQISLFQVSGSVVHKAQVPLQKGHLV